MRVLNHIHPNLFSAPISFLTQMHLFNYLLNILDAPKAPQIKHVPRSELISYVTPTPEEACTSSCYHRCNNAILPFSQWPKSATWESLWLLPPNLHGTESVTKFREFSFLISLKCIPCAVYTALSVGLNFPSQITTTVS